MLIPQQTAQFVADHRQDNVRDLALHAKRVSDIDMPLALDQIAGWQIARAKLPEWADCEDIVYPPHLAMEQCSSQFTARYKATVAMRVVGEPSTAQSRVVQSRATDTQIVNAGTVGAQTADDQTVGTGATDTGTVGARAADMGTVDVCSAGTQTVDVRAVDIQTVGTGATDMGTVGTQTADPHTADTQTAGVQLVDTKTVDAGTVDAHAAGSQLVGVRAVDIQAVSQATPSTNSPLTTLSVDSSVRLPVAQQPIPGCLIDLTGGFGVDCSYMARGFTRAVYIERQERLCELAAHNMHVLGLDHVRIVCGDATELLTSENGCFTDCASSSPALVFIDPARRDEHGSRTYAIEDCTPNVLALKDRLLSLAPHVMIKLSPMLDWRKTVTDFCGAVAEVHIVSTGNECKELLLVLDRDRHDDVTASPVRVYCVNDTDEVDFIYDPNESESSRSLGLKPLPQPISYLYEPNASLMKAGCFALIEQRYGVTQVGPNSHLFVSAELVADFPGRIFAIDCLGGMGKKELKTTLEGVDKANITVRNFPLTVAQLRKKLRLRDGGDTYLFATTMAGSKHVLIRCTKR